MDWPAFIPGAVAALAALGAYLQSRQNKGKISDVHVLVNNRLSEVTTRAEQLADALRAAGIIVPPKPGAE
jgi:hypothetical protein